MGLFSSNSSGARRETRSERRGREERLDSARRRAAHSRALDRAEQESEERSARFWRGYSA